MTSLRFLAAAMIVVAHSRGSFGIPTDWGEPFNFFLGVPFFFVLSGFLLCYVYPSLRGPATRRFLVARIARLWPAHAATFILVFLLVPPETRSTPHGYTVPAALANLAMVHAWIPSIESYFSFNTVSWSISTEFGLYLLFPLLINRWERTWLPKFLLTALIGGGLVYLTLNLGIPSAQYGQVGLSLDGLLAVNPIGNLHLFTLGMVTCLAWRMLTSRLRFGLLVGTLVEVAATAFAIWGVYAPSSMAYGKLIGSVAQWFWPIGYLPLVPLGPSQIGLAILILVMALERGLVSRFLSIGPLVLLGEISYSVYLTHALVLRSYYQHFSLLGNLPNPVLVVLFWLVTLLVSWLIWWAVERPVRRFVRAWWAAHEDVVPHNRWRVLGSALAAIVLLLLAAQAPLLGSPETQ